LQNKVAAWEKSQSKPPTNFKLPKGYLPTESICTHSLPNMDNSNPLW